MKAPARPNPEMVEVKRLAHLPLVGALRRELAVKATVDTRVPPPGRHAVTAGACVEALVWTSLTGEQALSRAADPLAGDDLAVMCQRPMDAAHCHDHRWGRVLEARWAAGVDRVYGAVSSPAIRP